MCILGSDSVAMELMYRLHALFVVMLTLIVDAIVVPFMYQRIGMHHDDSLDKVSLRFPVVAVIVRDG